MNHLYEDSDPRSGRPYRQYQKDFKDLGSMGGIRSPFKPQTSQNMEMNDHDRVRLEDYNSPGLMYDDLENYETEDNE